MLTFGSCRSGFCDSSFDDKVILLKSVKFKPQFHSHSHSLAAAAASAVAGRCCSGTAASVTCAVRTRSGPGRTRERISP